MGNRGRETIVAQDSNKPIIGEFRANGGKVGGGYAGAPLLILRSGLLGRRSASEADRPRLIARGVAGLWCQVSRTGRRISTRSGSVEARGSMRIFRDIEGQIRWTLGKAEARLTRGDESKLLTPRHRLMEKPIRVCAAAVVVAFLGALLWVGTPARATVHVGACLEVENETTVNQRIRITAPTGPWPKTAYWDLARYTLISVTLMWQEKQITTTSGDWSVDARPGGKLSWKYYTIYHTTSDAHSCKGIWELSIK